MPGGTIVDRQWVVVLHNGNAVIDWGDGLFQDIREGTFLHVKEQQISHPVTDEELISLKNSGCIDAYDEKRVSFIGLPENLKRSMQ
jgi:hypothetical protein